MHVRDFGLDPDIQRYIADPRQAVSINMANLSQELAEQSGWVSRFATLSTEAQYQKNLFKLALETVYARLFNKYRVDGMAEKTCAEMAKAEDEYVVARSNYLKAEYYEMLIDGICLAYKERGQMLISLTGLLRQEMQTGIRVFEERAKSVMLGGQREQNRLEYNGENDG